MCLYDMESKLTKIWLKSFYPALKIGTRMFYFNLCTQISGCKFKFLVYKVRLIGCHSGSQN